MTISLPSPSVTRKRRTFGLAVAISSAQVKAGPHARLVYASLPDATDVTSTYDFYLSNGFDQYAARSAADGPGGYASVSLRE
jgi:hypothetical protein